MNAALVEMNALADKHRKIFDLVCDSRDWRAPVDVTIDLAVFSALKIDSEDVSAAIEFFTATRPTFEAVLCGGRAAVTVRAAGYRAGPAGP